MARQDLAWLYPGFPPSCPCSRVRGSVSSLLNQLFGKGKEPFWQQAYTNLVRWIIELYRVFPERWVTLQEVYRCAIDPELFAAKIEEAEKSG